LSRASMQDILARHLQRARHLDNLADKVAIHLNDTHPAIGVAELMRLLVDEHGMPWAAPGRCAAALFLHQPHADARGAGDLAGGLMQHVLPRHLEIIFRINQEFLAEVPQRTGRATWTSWRACR
jgi:starch phosphorylase